MIKQKRLFWADALRVLSIFMVVSIHASSKILYSFSDVSTISWQFANIINSFSRISVPIFIMLSGAFILNKNENTKEFIKNRIPRIMLPWIFWGTLSFLIVNNFSLAVILQNGFANEISKAFLGGFWFMPVILGIYLVAPIIKPYIQKAKKTEWKYLLSLLFLISSIIPTLNNIVGINISLQIPNWIQYLGYFILGYYLTHKVKLLQTTKKEIYALFFMSIALIILGTTSFTVQNKEFFEGFYSYVNIFVVIASASGFVFLKELFESFEKKTFKYSKQFKVIKPKITHISFSSFGIFLSHALLLSLFEKGKLGFTFDALSVHPFVALPTLILLTFTSSLLIILAIKKFVPKLTKFVG